MRLIAAKINRNVFDRSNRKPEAPGLSSRNRRRRVKIGDIMRRITLTLALLALGTFPTASADISRTYSYFSIGGKTLSEIEEQLRSRGPHVQSTGQRHPGATRMEFKTRITYEEENRRCRIANVRVSVKARVFLPRWRNRRSAGPETALIWDTLSKDIKRHEESHLGIAKRYALSIENGIGNLAPRSSCEALQARAEQVTQKNLEEHDAAQARFDRIESGNFEWRLMRLLNYRLEQLEKGRNPG
ncbi:hypothetical protein A33O_02513 [Nitratireductor aquibiodomus RA22]|uniref:Peptidase n=2 Tax=Nitratireductor aquibiodomus TaxID=204799 RepID=I5C671_9HYPH|nr:hypothetical protein A33O_02513 [Nitratireductor aquibiodomus RA22]